MHKQNNSTIVLGLHDLIFSIKWSVGAALLASTQIIFVKNIECIQKGFVEATGTAHTSPFLTFFYSTCLIFY